MNTVKGPTGHAVVMLQPGGINSIVLVQGANISWPRLEDGIGRLTTTVQQLIRRAGAVLLQREVPDSVNLEAAKVRAMSSHVWLQLSWIHYVNRKFVHRSDALGCNF